jgi:hypothetical protein
LSPIQGGLVTIGDESNGVHPALKPSGSTLQIVNNAGTDVGNLAVGTIRVGSLTDNVQLFSGAGTPEGAVTASIGSLFLRRDGGASTTFYVKESGTGATGWVAK